MRVETALVHLGLVGHAAASTAQHAAGITMSEIAHRSIVNMRGDAKDAAFTVAVKAATGIDLLAKASTLASDGGRQVLWFGPSEWSVTASDGKAAGKA